MSDSAEKVDVAIVGAGLAGLATAVALHKVRPDAIIKVCECCSISCSTAVPTPANTAWSTMSQGCNMALAGPCSCDAVMALACQQKHRQPVLIFTLQSVSTCNLLQVYERRKAPEGLQCTQEDANADPKDSTSKKDSSSAAPDIDAEFISRLGGGVRLEMNGLKAVAAISRDLAAGVVGSGLYANKVLLHDTLGELSNFAARTTCTGIPQNWVSVPSNLHARHLETPSK